jgi:hypothetical protein
MNSVSGGSVSFAKLCRQRERSYDLGQRADEDRGKERAAGGAAGSDDGLPAGRRDYTVRHVGERDPSTVKNRMILARRHLLPALGSRRLAERTAD